MDGSKVAMVIPPIAFSRIADGIYRSAYPAPKSVPFVDSLQLKSIVSLAPSDIKKELRDYCAKRDITICECNVGLNQEPFVTMSEKSVADAVDFMSDPTNHPVLVFCTTGRSKTSVVVGCYRRYQMHVQPRESCSLHACVFPFSSPCVHIFRNFGALLLCLLDQTGRMEPRLDHQ